MITFALRGYVCVCVNSMKHVRFRTLDVQKKMAFYANRQSPTGVARAHASIDVAKRRGFIFVTSREKNAGDPGGVRGGVGGWVSCE